MNGIRSFQNRISGGDSALFYYSGHGVQINGKNYLIPLGTDLIYEADAEFEAVDMDFVLSSLERSGSNRNIIIFDACRNNALKKDSKSSVKGLAILQRELPESIVIYSTSPGEVAMDGKGRNSPFAGSFIKNIQISNLSLNDLVMKVTKDVRKSTGFQRPWRTSSLTEPFFFVKQAGYKKSNNITFEAVYGSLLINVVEEGILYIDNQRIGSFRKGESKKIPELSTGEYRLKYTSKGKSEYKTITIGDSNITKVKFLWEISSLIDMVLVKAGTFQMGSNNGASDEKPVHLVTISKDFYIGKYEVTQKQWKAVMGSNPFIF